MDSVSSPYLISPLDTVACSIWLLLLNSASAIHWNIHELNLWKCLIQYLGFEHIFYCSYWTQHPNQFVFATIEYSILNFFFNSILISKCFFWPTRVPLWVQNRSCHRSAPNIEFELILLMNECDKRVAIVNDCEFSILI